MRSFDEVSSLGCLNVCNDSRVNVSKVLMAFISRKHLESGLRRVTAVTAGRARKKLIWPVCAGQSMFWWRNIRYQLFSRSLSIYAGQALLWVVSLSKGRAYRETNLAKVDSWYGEPSANSKPLVHQWFYDHLANSKMTSARRSKTDTAGQSTFFQNHQMKGID